jgi:hypothetical protein
MSIKEMPHTTDAFEKIRREFIDTPPEFISVEKK